MGAIDRARMLALARSVQVAFDTHDVEAEQHYSLDAQSFGRVVDNLLTNAINAVEEHGEVEATMTQTATGLTLTVADDGPGMPEDFIPRAFERFSRPDAARSSSTGGSGLGLALVDAIVTTAGGQVGVRNLSRGGLEVVIEVPKM
jgi:signal transduction histidine kinase